MSDEMTDERRVNWARTTADVAVIKEIQIQQTATLAKIDGKLDLLWDNYQRSQGSLDTRARTEVRWRWGISLAVTFLGAVLAARIGHVI